MLIDKHVKLIMEIVLLRRAMEACSDPVFLPEGRQVEAIHKFGVQRGLVWFKVSSHHQFWSIQGLQSKLWFSDSLYPEWTISVASFSLV